MSDPQELFKACVNPCLGCPKQHRLEGTALKAAEVANFSAAMLENTKSEIKYALDVAFHAAEMVIQESEESGAYLAAMGRIGIRIPTAADIEALDKKEAGYADNKDEAVDALNAIGDQQREIANACDGPRQIGVGPLVVRYCTSDEVPFYSSL